MCMVFCELFGNLTSSTFRSFLYLAMLLLTVADGWVISFALCTEMILLLLSDEIAGFQQHF